MKKRIIIISIVAFVMLLNIILFGFVFCLRKQTVKVQGEDIGISASEIIESAKLKNGKSIFGIDKDEAINNIEQTYPTIKVIQIKTVSVVEVEIVVRKRYETYFKEHNSQYFIMDEDLKVMRIETEKPQDMVEIKADLRVTNNTKVCNFVGNSVEKNVFSNLVFSLMRTVKVGVDPEAKFVERGDIHLVATSLSIETGYTLTGTYARLIIETPKGVTLDIGRATEDLDRKINMCYSALNDTDFTETSGVIRLHYSGDGMEQFGYYANN